MFDRISNWVAYRLPHRVIYWALIRVFAHVTTGPYSGTDVHGFTITEALQRWNHER